MSVVLETSQAVVETKFKCPLCHSNKWNSGCPLYLKQDKLLLRQSLSAHSQSAITNLSGSSTLTCGKEALDTGCLDGSTALVLRFPPRVPATNLGQNDL